MKTTTKLIATVASLSLMSSTGLTLSNYVRTGTLKIEQHKVYNGPIKTELSASTVGGSTTNTVSGVSGSSLSIEESGYYLIQLRGGDGGNGVVETYGQGGAGGLVEGVFYLNKGDVLNYSIGAAGGKFNSSSARSAGLNGTANDSNLDGGIGGENYTGGDKNEGRGGGGATVVTVSGLTSLELVAAGGGGAGGSKDGTELLDDSPCGGNGGLITKSSTHESGYNGQTLTAVQTPSDDNWQSNDNKNGQDGYTLVLFNYYAGGGAGGGGKSPGLGGAAGDRNSLNPRYGGQGGSSYISGGQVSWTDIVDTLGYKLPDDTELHSGKFAIPTHTYGDGTASAGAVRIYKLSPTGPSKAQTLDVFN
jgi:hypothetical protein